MTSTETIYRVTEKDFVPGPAQYSPPSDFGNGRKYTIGHRIGSKSSRGPGYENIPTTIGEGHKYSLGTKPKELSQFVTPGPTFVPPKFGTGAPASTLHQRSVQSARSISPGPKYDNRLPSRGHQFTLKARRFQDEEKVVSPGPGVYKPEYDNVLPSPRKTQIGNVIRTKDGNSNPGPGKYDIDRNLINHPASFHSRIDMKKKDWVPGPGKYEPEKHYQRDTPAYSLRSRINTPTDVIRAPYQQIPSKIGEGYKYSLGCKPNELKGFVTPGPNYQPPKFGSDSIKCSLSSRHERKRDISKEPPGPGQYQIEPPNDGRKWTMKARNFRDTEKHDGPGSGAYMPNYERVLPSVRRNQILERITPKKEAPGPGYYDLGSTFSGPKITIGRKESLAVRPGRV